MRPTIVLDDRAWKAAARALKADSERTMVDFINGQALFVVKTAEKETQRAESAKIAVELGQVGTKVKISKNRKTGKTRWKKAGRLIDANLTSTLAARLVGRMWDKSAFKPKQAAKLEGKTLEEQIRIFINWRTRAAAFIASGWIPAIKKFASVVYSKPRRLPGGVAAKQIGVPKGSAKPATFAMRSVITAVAENTALKTTSELGSGNPMPIATAGLQRALDLSAKDMIAELARRLQKDADKVNAR